MTRSHTPDRALPGRPNAAERDPLDFYRTPRVAVEKLLDVEAFDGPIYEPACGDGAISEVLIERGYRVLSTDLVDRGYGLSGVNFLGPLPSLEVAPKHLITNPPFRRMEEFAVRALNVVPGKVALLGRLLWLEGEARHRRLFAVAPPARVWIFSKRVNLARGGDPRWRDGEGGMVAFAWYVWDPDHFGAPELGWI